MSEQIDTNGATRKGRRNKIGAMRAAPTPGSPEATREVAEPAPRTRGRKPRLVEQAAATVEDFNVGPAPKRRGRPPKAQSNGAAVAAPASRAVPQGIKRSAAHTSLIARIDALVALHDTRKVAKLLDAVEALR